MDRFPFPTRNPKTPAQSEALTWDGTSGGARAASGVYLFQVQAEDASVTGTLVVVR